MLDRKFPNLWLQSQQFKRGFDQVQRFFHYSVQPSTIFIKLVI